MPTAERREVAIILRTQAQEDFAFIDEEHAVLAEPAGGLRVPATPLDENGILEGDIERQEFHRKRPGERLGQRRIRKDPEEEPAAVRLQLPQIRQDPGQAAELLPLSHRADEMQPEPRARKAARRMCGAA